jgi:hypothetical protein
MEVIGKIENMFHDTTKDSIYSRIDEILDLIERVKDIGTYNYRNSYYRREVILNKVSLILQDTVTHLEYIDGEDNVNYLYLRLLIGNIVFVYEFSFEDPIRERYKYYQLSDECRDKILDQINKTPLEWLETFDSGIYEISKPEKIIKSHIKSARN